MINCLFYKFLILTKRGPLFKTLSAFVLNNQNKKPPATPWHANRSVPSSQARLLLKLCRWVCSNPSATSLAMPSALTNSLVCAQHSRTICSEVTLKTHALVFNPIAHCTVCVYTGSPITNEYSTQLTPPSLTTSTKLVASTKTTLLDFEPLHPSLGHPGWLGDSSFISGLKSCIRLKRGALFKTLSASKLVCAQ